MMQGKAPVDPSDRAFDRHLPVPLRFASARHWTPLGVVARAAEWLEELEVRSVVDIGSGAGKFCVAAALATRADFTGIEERPHLVAAARSLAKQFDVEARVRFVEGALGRVALPAAQAYYLYNPFGENLLGRASHLDAEMELSQERFAVDVGAMEELLRTAPVGTYVLTYNGFGGHIPDTFELARADRTFPNVLRLWRKLRARARGQYYVSDER